MAGRLRSGPLLRAVALALAGVSFGCTDPVSEARTQTPPLSPSSSQVRSFPVHPGAKVSGRLVSGEAHVYTVELSEGTFFFARVEQRGVDVVVAVIDPAGQPILEVDSPNASRGSEPIPWVASQSGTHQISIRALEDEIGGEYELRLVESRRATDRDRDHGKAAALLTEAERQRRKPQMEAHEKAIQLYSQAANLLRSAGTSGEEAVALRRLSQVQLAQNRPEEALAALDQALSFIHGGGEPQQEAGILSAKGQVLRRLNRRPEARRSYEQAIEVARAGQAPLEEAAAWNNLADLQQENGELARALAGYDRALLGWRRNGRKRAEATVLHNLGSLYLGLNRLPEARDCLLRSLALQKSDGSPESRAFTLTVLGQVHAWQEEPRSALSYYRQALVLARRAGNPWSQAILLDKLGSSHLDLGNAQQALVLHERAAAMFRKLEDQGRLGWVLANLGWLHESQGRPERALPLYREALALLSPLEDRLGEAVAFFGEARIAHRRGDLETARLKLELALRRIESLRADAPGPSLRSSFLAARQGYYEHYVSLLMDLHHLQPQKGWDVLALEASERTRARSFLDTLGGARLNLQEHADRELLRRDRELLDRLDALETERMAGSRREGLEREQRDILLERESLLARMHDEKGQRLPPPPVPLTMAQMRGRVLDSESLLLVYALGEERSFLWLVDRHSVRSFVLNGREQIEPLARAAWELLSQRAGSSTQARLVLDRLAREILGPAAAHLGTSRLLIVADGALRYVPFAALPEPGSDSPLLVHHEIVYLDSSSVLSMQRQQLAGRPRAPLELAVVADPVFHAADPRLAKAPAAPVSAYAADLRRSAKDLGVRGFGRLPESGREAAALLAWIPQEKGLVAVGFAARKETVLSGVLSRYRIVHFATHGLIHPHHPELSGLVLSLVDEKGRPLDGFLRAYELQTLDLQADLVVLSACRTALGQEVPGEGLVGMTRGFMEAGAPRLVVSLWSVEDRSTAELMGRFYRSMFQSRLKPSAALREAQLSMLREPQWSNPRYWAPFLFQGEWR